MHRRDLLALCAAVAIAVAAPAFAHHSWPVNTDKEVTVKGTVTSYTWENPHVMIGLDVAAEGGKMEKWSVGGPSVTRMAANGWGPSTLKPGDVITGIGYQFSDGQKILRLQKVVLTGGKEMFLYGRP